MEPTSAESRSRREARTVEVMIGIFCRDHHGRRVGLCPDCGSLLDYCRTRVEKCPLKNEKPTCAKCAIHCYEAARREQIRNVMRYSGPRMLSRHPVLAILHIVDGRRS